MKPGLSIRFLCVAAGALWSVPAWCARGAEDGVRFNRDIRPILSENCFHCHGQDAAKRKAELRLDTPEGAFGKGKSGQAAFVPGKPEESAAFLRMVSEDPDDRMPPADSHRQVSPKQVELVRRWIAEGAKYETHWAFTPPVRPETPGVKDARRVKDGLDAFVLARLEKEGRAFAPEAAPEAWLRRASFDLTGLAPEPAEVDAFIADVAARGEAAYEAAVDRLLNSPRYGERQAAEWMDVARYADTHGYNNDTARTMWRWRDWVIDAFNNNLSYDQFITLQLAGDLLPNAGHDERLATGFGRNHVINSEGGIIDEEYRVEYVADRVRTLGMAWLGLTLECARCHDHKYDPISTKDYYRLFAFFNQVSEHGEAGRVANAAPLMLSPTPEQRVKLTELERKVQEAKAAAPVAPGGEEVTAETLDALRRAAERIGEEEEAILKDALFSLGWRDGKPVNALRPDDVPAKEPSKLKAEANAATGAVIDFPDTKEWTLKGDQLPIADHKAWTFAFWVRWRGGEGALISSMAYDRAPSSTGHGEGKEIRVNAEGKVEARLVTRWPAYSVHVVSREALRPGQWAHVAVVNTGGMKAANLRMFLDGREVEVIVRQDDLSGGTGGHPFRVGTTNETIPARFKGRLAGLRGWRRALTSAELRRVYEHAAARWALLDDAAGVEFRENHVQGLNALAALERDRDAFEKDAVLRELEEARLALIREFPQVMVMDELPEPRETRVLSRGNYDAPGEVVTAGVPEALLGAWPEGAPANRLGLARWLTKPDHPLTARVVVNRFWQQLFGTGLVKTAEDFGFQGEYPSHPELLDYLAREFVDGGWNVKGFLRRLALSTTYRQDSAWRGPEAAADPENRLLGRGPRVRLPAESIRDHALAISGLLKHRLGGPPVFPYQPPDLYKGVVVDAPYPGSSWTDSTGDDLFRRSLYTFWKRTVPHPVMLGFDMPDREFCVARRSRTNTPLQALTLMNEPAFLQAAARLGLRMRAEGGPDLLSRLSAGFRLATGRVPNELEKAALQWTWTRFRDSWLADPAGAAEFLKAAGVTVPEEGIPETAAYAAIGNTLLNLDETITKY